MNHTCPFSRYCVVDEAFDFSFTLKSNCSCSSIQWDRDDHLPGVIRQRNGCELCLHKALWPPDAHDYMGASFLFLVSLVGGAVGIGGGGLAVPILVITMGFHAKEAVPLSHVGVFGSVFAQNLVNVPRRHPLTDARPLVDAELALLLMPAMLLGNSLGVLVSPAVPEQSIEVFAVIVLLFAALKTILSGYKAFLKEIDAGKRVQKGVADAATPPAAAAPGGLPTPLSEQPPSTPHTLDLRPGGLPTTSVPQLLLPGSAPPSSLRDNLLPNGMPRSDAIDEPTVLGSARAALTPLHVGGGVLPFHGNEAHEMTGDLVFLAHAPRAFVRQHLLARSSRPQSPIRSMSDSLDIDAMGHELMSEGLDSRLESPFSSPSTSGRGNQRVVVVVREFPLPIDGARVLLLLLTWVLFAAQYRLDNTDWAHQSAESLRTERCESGSVTSCLYWLLPFLSLRVALWAGILAVNVTAFQMTIASQRQRESYHVAPLPGDLVWSLHKTLATQSMGLLVGMVAGLIGLGGGELMAPLLVHLGVLPEVVSAVNAFIIFFTAAADLEHYSDLGVLQLYADTITRPGYVVLAILIGFSGAILGRAGASRLIAKSAHPSALVCLLGMTLLLSASLLVGRVIQREQQQVLLSEADLACSY